MKSNSLKTAENPRDRRTRRSRVAPFAFAFAAALAVTPAFAGVERENVDKTFPAAGVQEVSVQNINGDVVVAVHAADTIEIHAEKTARGANAAEILKNLEVSIRTVGNRLEIESIHPKKKKFLGLFDLGSADCSVRYAIKVPAGKNLDLETVNGGVDVSGIEARIKAETVNGSIALDAVKGEVDAATVNGSVSITRSGGAGPMKLETVNGNVDIALAKDASFSYSFETVNGRIDSDFPMSVEGKWGPKSARGNVGSGAVSIAAESVNGSIKVRGK